MKLGPGANYTLSTPTAYNGAVYTGLVVGATADGRVVKPVAEQWPSATGVFSMTLPSSVRGKTIAIWENQRQSFSRFAAVPGGAIDLASWPVQLGPAVPAGLARLKLP